ncbi:MAG: tetratricopeptide repeat protein [Candidatus Marinimicrobia bacterium]|nr:tetratricopeptide repeat protein [Candidatus Neomarinimicrobiota bacterium]
MPSEPKRKLAAIMFTDMVGYTALMQKDESKARILIERHRALMKPFVEKHDGEIIQFVGDGTFCRFDSAIEAVNSAVEIQKVLRSEKDLVLRIGIHVGDIVIKGEEVYGDGVNVASRIEPLAEPGGVCISERVYDDIRNQSELEAHLLGERVLKNVERPINIYSLILEDKKMTQTMSKDVVLMGKENDNGVRSIAVLPFVNMSSDPENEYFGDGLAEEIINALTKIQDLRVASRTSSFAFKGAKEDIRVIGEKLNVETLLEGSVRKQGNQLRMTAQLIKVEDGYHIWSETYDRELKNIFAIQDEITDNIIKSLKVFLSDNEKKLIKNKPSIDIKAYDFYLRARKFMHSLTKKNFNYALKMLFRAIEIDPNYAIAYASIAECHCWLYLYHESKQENLIKAEEASQRSIELGPDLAETHVSRGYAASINKKYIEAESEFRTAIGINPKLYEAYYFYGRTCLVQGKLEEASQLFEKASVLLPEDYQALNFLGSVLRGLGDIEKAIEAESESLKRVGHHLELNPDDVRALYLGAGAHIKLGNKKLGLEWSSKALELEPEDVGVLYNVACSYSFLGKIDEAIELLEKAVDGGFDHVEWIENDADLDPLRDHPKFRSLIEKIK